MAGPIAWLTDSASSAYRYTADSISSVTSSVTNAVSGAFGAVQSTVGNLTSSVLSRVFTPPVVRKLIEGWQGFSVALNFPAISHALLAKPKSRKVMLRSMQDNLILYMMPVMLYEYSRTQFIQPNLNMEDPRVSWAEYGFDRMIHLFFIRLSIDKFVSNALNYVSMSTALADELPADEQLKPCKHVEKDQAALVTANLMSAPYYYMNLAFASAASAIPVVGRFIEWPLKRLVYGQSLVEYKLAVGQQCTQDRYDTLARNNAYAFGAGLSLEAGIVFWSWVVKSYTGVESSYVTAALTSFLYTYHIMAAYLIGKPLPGKQSGIDFFSYPRMVTDGLIKDGVNRVVPLLEGPKGDLYERAQKKLEERPYCWAKSVLLKDNLQSFPAFMQREDAKIFLLLHKDKIGDGLDEILKIRKSKDIKIFRVAKKINKFSPVDLLKSVSPETQQIIKYVILHKELESIIKDIKKFLDEADRLANPSKRLRIKDDREVPAPKERQGSSGLTWVDDQAPVAPAASKDSGILGEGRKSHRVFRMADVSAAMFAAQNDTSSPDQKPYEKVVFGAL